MRHRFCILLSLICACSANRSNVEPVNDQPNVVETNETTETEKTMSENKSVTELGAEVVTTFYAGDLDGLYIRFSNRMKKALTPEQWQASFEQIVGGLGKETSVVSETESRLSGIRVYRRRATFEKTGEKEFEVVVAFGHDDLIEGFSITEPKVAAPSKYLDYKTKTDLTVPWRGEWTIVWGGREIEKNYHAIAPDQRFALDVLKLGKDEKSYEGANEKNQSYHAFSQEVYAPGSGVVVAMENSVADNVPGEMNPKQAMGNHVIIDHENGEFSVIAHFQQGSVKVAIGQKLEQGELLGLCGNSGNSSEAHIHYHLQNTAKPFDGEGLPIQFRSATINGQLVENVELIQAQRVSPASE